MNAMVGIVKGVALFVGLPYALGWLLSRGLFSRMKVSMTAQATLVFLVAGTTGVLQAWWAVGPVVRGVEEPIIGLGLIQFQPLSAAAVVAGVLAGSGRGVKVKGGRLVRVIAVVLLACLAYGCLAGATWIVFTGSVFQ